jgi:hypothetical protein
MAELIGRLVQCLLAQGSKSEHLALVLIDAQGRQHVLRRAGANPFKDELLTALLGQQLRLQGHVEGESLVFWVETWAPIPPSSPSAR